MYPSTQACQVANDSRMCGAAAETTCDRCGRPMCGQHFTALTLKVGPIVVEHSACANCLALPWTSASTNVQVMERMQRDYLEMLATLTLQVVRQARAAGIIEVVVDADGTY